jgi:hypothetical protein
VPPDASSLEVEELSESSPAAAVKSGISSLLDADAESASESIITIVSLGPRFFIDSTVLSTSLCWLVARESSPS